MDIEKKKIEPGKILSEIQQRVQTMEFLAFLESIKRFERTNGRKPTWDETKDMAKNLHISLDSFCALLRDYPSDDIFRDIGLT